ncbi:MAG: response regulator transcription factor [Chloroflexi bacterium]|nr:response regulator transcription factor [Chloroflexota bacterium]
MPERILVIDDEPKIVEVIRRGLLFDGYQVEVAYDGTAGLAQARDISPDLIVLDLMLPGIDGLEVCRRVRAASDVPILMLTAKDTVPDRVAGLDSGADDYLVKPFALDELLARIRAMLRRHKPEAKDTLKFADLTMNTSTHQVWRGARGVELTAKEYDLLEFFMRHPKQVLTREQIYDHVWGYDFGGDSNIIEVYVRYLRTKLEAGEEHRLIQTLRGVGYALREE